MAKALTCIVEVERARAWDTVEAQGRIKKLTAERQAAQEMLGMLAEARDGVSVLSCKGWASKQ